MSTLLARKPPSSAEIRAVFGENLRELCAREKSVSVVCREIGVNRTQFSRYLSGEAFPRPDLLLRICDYFGVDANILIHPINSVGQGGVEKPDVLAMSFQKLAAMLPGDSYAVGEQQLASGLYRVWRRSFMWPEYVFRATALVWREGPLTRYKAYEPTANNLLYLEGEPALPERRHGRNVVMRQYRGVVLNVNHSLCILTAPPEGSTVMRSVTLKPGFSGISDVYSGHCMLLRAVERDALSFSGAVMEPLRIGFRDLLKHSRQKAFYKADELPTRLARYMFETQTL